MTDDELRKEIEKEEELAGILIQRLHDLGAPFRHLSAHLDRDPELLKQTQKTNDELTQCLNRIENLRTSLLSRIDPVKLG